MLLDASIAATAPDVWSAWRDDRVLCQDEAAVQDVTAEAAKVSSSAGFGQTLQVLSELPKEANVDVHDLGRARPMLRANCNPRT